MFVNKVYNIMSAMVVCWQPECFVWWCVFYWQETWKNNDTIVLGGRRSSYTIDVYCDCTPNRRVQKGTGRNYRRPSVARQSILKLPRGRISSASLRHLYVIWWNDVSPTELPVFCFLTTLSAKILTWSSRFLPLTPTTVQNTTRISSPNPGQSKTRQS